MKAVSQSLTLSPSCRIGVKWKHPYQQIEFSLIEMSFVVAAIAACTVEYCSCCLFWLVDIRNIRTCVFSLVFVLRWYLIAIVATRHRAAPKFTTFFTIFWWFSLHLQANCVSPNNIATWQSFVVLNIWIFARFPNFLVTLLTSLHAPYDCGRRIRR